MSDNSLAGELKSELNTIERTIRILDLVKDEEPIGIKKLSEKLETEDHKVRYSLRLLEKDNIIEPTSHGASLTKDHAKAEGQLKSDLKEMKNTLNELIAVLSE
ncbi:MAG: hypothetical protein V5A88_09525 [Candidatus Thermoplasmatota archaeon]